MSNPDLLKCLLLLLVTRPQSGKNFPRVPIAMAVGFTVLAGNGIIWGAAKFQNAKHGFS